MCFRQIIDNSIPCSTRGLCARLGIYNYVVADDCCESVTLWYIGWRIIIDIHVSDCSVIYSVKDIIFNNGVFKSACYDATYPGNARIGTCVIENIVMNIDIFRLVSGSRRCIVVEHPDARTISIMDSIVVNFYVIHNTSRLFDLDTWPACTPVIERID